MSYLSYPRINFSGKFFTDPSTVNNDPTHFIVNDDPPSPWQNPNGLHQFKLVDCKIYSIIGRDKVEYPVKHPIFTTDQPAAAKIVDIDVYQQGVATIYGMEVSFQISEGVSLKGVMDPAVLNQLWWVAVLATRSWQDSDYSMDSFGGDMNACGIYQSVIRVHKDNWPADAVSETLALLRSRTVHEGEYFLISIRFVLDGYRNVPESKDYQTGRITGALGPVIGNEPRYNAGSRWLAGRKQNKNDPWNWPMFNNVQLVIDQERKKMILDLANGICRKNAGGAPVDLGALTAWICPANRSPVKLAEINYSVACYNHFSHIVEIPLTDDQLNLAMVSPINLIMARDGIGPKLVFAEDITQTNIEVEVRPIRMEGAPGTTQTTRVYVSKLGKPMVGKQLQVEVISVHGNTPGATVPKCNPGNTPQADGAIEAMISATDTQGYATVTIKVLKDPGFRTPLLDGQLYFINVTDPFLPKPDPISQSSMISCLVWSDYKVIDDPGWKDIQLLFAGFVKLFPGMTEKLNLSNFPTFQTYALNPPWASFRDPKDQSSYKPTCEAGFQDPECGEPGCRYGICKGAIGFFMSRDITDPRYMPLSRDMSPARIKTVFNYLKKLIKTPIVPPTP